MKKQSPSAHISIY